MVLVIIVTNTLVLKADAQEEKRVIQIIVMHINVRDTDAVIRETKTDIIVTNTIIKIKEPSYLGSFLYFYFNYDFLNCVLLAV